MSILLGVLVACGGDDGETTIDAPRAIDAAIDAPAALSGLGQKCGAGMPACPTGAPLCVGVPGGNSFCTVQCLNDGTAMTNASGQITSTTPAANHAACTAAYTGTGGTAACGLLTAISPMDNPLMANKNYTGIDMVCGIVCGGGGACPASTTCNTTLMLCLPN